MTENKPLVLLVEDEDAMRKFLRTTLGLEGYRLIEVTTIREAQMAAATHHPEIILLDLGLPDGDGLDFIRSIREWSRVPILVLSARARESDKVNALDFGADDYVTKPFSVSELFARMRVALRHARAASGGTEEATVNVGPLKVDFTRREVFVDGALVRLTPTEFRLVALFARHPGRVLTHRQILREVWGARAPEQAHYVRVFMAQLRRKMERESARPRLFVTEPGVGYRLRDDEA